MLPRDVGLICAHECAVAYDVLASDDEPIDAVRRREDEPGHRIARPAELEHVGPPDGEVGALPGLERADVVPAKDGGAATRPEPEGLPDGQCCRPTDSPGDEGPPAVTAGPGDDWAVTYDRGPTGAHSVFLRTVSPK